MFALVAAGRAPEQFTQVGEAEFLSEIPSVDSINHVVVFMTGSQPFPDGIGGSVYIRWQAADSDGNWHYLGFICNQKPSAIFKIAQLHKMDAKHSNIFGTSAFNSVGVGSAQIGIMAESLTCIEGKVAEMDTTASKQSTLAEFGDRMVRNLVNHVESYAVNMPKPDGTGRGDFIPLQAFQQWVSNFTRRFQQNPYFWKTLNNT